MIEPGGSNDHGRRLDGRRALVTGSTSGIGAGIAHELAARGARVLVTGRDAERGRAVAESILASGGEALFAAAHLEADDGPQRLAGHASEALGGSTSSSTMPASSPSSGPRPPTRRPSGGCST